MTSHNEEEGPSGRLAAMDLAYHGRNGLGVGAWWDSVRYLGRILVVLLRRFRLRRRLQRARNDLHRSMDGLLSSLGKMGLYMDGLEAPMLSEFRSRLDALTSSKDRIQQTLVEGERQWQQDNEAFDDRLATMQGRLTDAQKQEVEARLLLDDLVEQHQAIEQKVRRLSLEYDYIREQQIGQGTDGAAAGRPGASPRSDSKSGRRDRIVRERDALTHRMEALKPKLHKAEQKYREQTGVVSDLKEDLRAFSADRDRLIFEAAVAEERKYAELEGAASSLKDLYLEAGRVIYQNRLVHPGLENTMDRLDDMERSKGAVEADLNLIDSPEGGVFLAPIFKSFLLFGVLVASGVSLGFFLR